MAYAMTQGEQIVYNEINAQIKAIKDWGFFTTAASRRSDRMAVNRVKDIATLNLQDPKKSYVIANLNVLWNNWMTWSKLGQSALQKRMLSGLNSIQVAMTLEPAVVTVEEVTEVQATQPVLPAVVPIPAVVPEVPAVKPPEDKKLFGLPRWIAIGGISVITIIGGVTYYFATRKKK